MYVNPFWFGFGCGVVATIIFIIIVAAIYSMKCGKNEATKEVE